MASGYSIDELLPTFYQDVINIKSAEDSETVITWQDGHQSRYASMWLYMRRFDTEMSNKRLESLLPLKNVERKLWCGPDFRPKKVAYMQVTKTDEGFVEFSEAMMSDGCCILTGAPLEHCFDDWVKKTGILITESSYGKTFEVKNKRDVTNIAYTAYPLDLHTDQNYLIFRLKIQYLHCEVQTEDGGENTLVDGIYAANRLRNENLQEYKVLTETLIDNNDTLYEAKHDEHPHVTYDRRPLISVDPVSGDPTHINFNNFPRSSFFNEPIEKVERWYEAMKIWLRILNECQIVTKSSPGDILIFDNHRLMHGRLAFNANQDRLLEGWYSEWDWIYSGWRIAKRNLLKKKYQGAN